MTAFVRSGRPGWRLRTANPLIAGGFLAQRGRRLLRDPYKAATKARLFRSIADLQAAINRFLEEHNQKSQPFTWTANPDEIIAAVRRGHQALNSIRSRGSHVLV